MKPSKILHRLVRGIKLYLTYFFVELPRGLDFSRRNLSVLQGSNAEYHGYAVTTKTALKNIHSIVSLKDKKVLDIGSGKGNVLYHAAMFGAETCVGLEFHPHLHSVACKNFLKLGIQTKCKSINIPAENYSSYSDHDLFFLFNPFDYMLYRKIVERVINQVGLTGTSLIILYGAHDDSVLKEYSEIRLLYSGVCPDRKNPLKIYQF